MTLLAHAGHWLAQLLYLAPVLAMVGAIVWAKLRGPQGEEDEDDPLAPGQPDRGHAGPGTPA